MNTSFSFKKFPFLSTNADVLTADKLRELKIRIHENSPSIMMIQEAKPKNFNRILTKAEYEIPDYDLEWVNMSAGDPGRGLITYVKKGINYKLVEDLGNHYTEYLAVSIEINKKEKLLAVNLYHSPDSSEANSKELNRLILKIAAEKKYDFVVITGDGNFKHINWHSMTCSQSETSKDFSFLEVVKDAFLDQHVKQPTRGRGSDTPSTLDLVLSKNDDVIEDIAIEAPIGKSDHAMIYGNLACNFESKPIKKTRYLYDKANYEKLRKMMPKWEDILKSEEMTVDEMWKHFKDKITAAIDECIPKKTVIINGPSSRRRGKKMDNKTRAKIKRKHRLWEAYIRTGDGQRYLEYCRVRNQVRALTRKLQKELEKQVAKQAKTNSKKFWQFVKNKTKSRPTIPDLLLDDDEDDDNAKYTTTDQEKANRFNEFFASVFNPKTHEPNKQLPKRTDKMISDIVINNDIVKKALKKLKPGKSPGPDGLHPRVLKEASDEIAPALTIIYQASMKHGELPEEWLWANVSPIFKKGKKHIAGNYRPVSLTCIACKVLEGIIREEVMKFLKSNKILSPKQFGFLSGRSCTLQLLTMLDKWTSILDRGGAIDVIYFDFMKAFDKVAHGRLLQKLKAYGIDGNLHAWIKAFLTDRRQRVTVNGANSSWEQVTSGVPQGSVLGPLLFVVFIDDMPEVVDDNSLCIMFADDAKLSREIATLNDKEAVQEDINRLSLWADDNGMSHHPGKCHVLKIGERELTLHDMFEPYRLKDNILDVVHEEKDLGVIIDQDLNFESHFAEKVKKANMMIGIIRRSFLHLDEEMFLQLYKALVRPHLEYANQVWSPRLAKHVTLIENVQRRATKLVPGLADLEYEDRLRKLKLPTLAYRRLRGDLIEVYKIMTGKYDSEVCEGLIARREGERSTGHPHKIFKERPRHEMRKHVFPHRVVDLWNRRRMGGVVKAETVKEFEARLDMVLVDQELVFDYQASTQFSQLANVFFDDTVIIEEENIIEDPAS